MQQFQIICALILMILWALLQHEKIFLQEMESLTKFKAKGRGKGPETNRMESVVLVKPL